VVLQRGATRAHRAKLGISTRVLVIPKQHKVYGPKTDISKTRII